MKSNNERVLWESSEACLKFYLAAERNQKKIVKILFRKLSLIHTQTTHDTHTQKGVKLTYCWL